MTNSDHERLRELARAQLDEMLAGLTVESLGAVIESTNLDAIAAAYTPTPTPTQFTFVIGRAFLGFYLTKLVEASEAGQDTPPDWTRN